MADLLDDDDVEINELDESDHSFSRKRPTEASWDSDDELLQEDHIPLKKSRGHSLSEVDEDALLGDSDEDIRGEDRRRGGQTVEADYGGENESNTGGQMGELSVNYSAMLDDTEGDEWGATRGEGESGVTGAYEEEYPEHNPNEVGGEIYNEGGGDNYEEGGEYEGGGETYEGTEDTYAEEGFEEEAVPEQTTVKDDDDAILEDAIELEPGMDDFLDIEDLDDSLIEEVAEERTVRGSGARPTTSTPSVPVREKAARDIKEVEEQMSRSDDQTSSQPRQVDEEEGSDTKEDIPSSDDDEDDDDDTTRARFKSERQPVTVKVGGVSKRKDIPETLEITAEIQHTVDEFARQKEEQSNWRRNRGRGGRGFRGNRGNQGIRNRGQPPHLMGIRYPGIMGPRFPGVIGPGFMHINAPPLSGDLFQQAQVVRGPPAGHLRGGRFDFEPYKPDKEMASRIPPLITQGQGPEQSGSSQPTPGGQISVPTTSQASPAQHTSQSGTPVSSQSQAPKSKTIHINPHFKGQVQVPSQQGGPPPPHHAPSSVPPPNSQFQPPASTQSHSYQPPVSYPQSNANQYPPQSQQPPPSQFQQQGPPLQGHSQSQPQTHMQTHPQGTPPFVDQQRPAGYGQQQQHFRPQQSEPLNPPASQHQTPGGWSQPGRPDPVSVTWSHQHHGPPRQEQGYPPYRQPPPCYNGPHSPHERFLPPHQHHQGPRQQQPRGMQPNRMRPHGEPQHMRAPQAHQQRPGYRQPGPSPVRQVGPRQQFKNSNQRQQPRQPSPRQPSPRQPSPSQPLPQPQQATSSQPSAQNPVHKGRILPSPKRLIEEASKKASKLATAKPKEGQIDEDAETKRLRIQLGEQKKLREMILQRKEARRQQLAASKQAELKKRMAGQKKKEGASTQETSQPQQQQQQRQPQPNQGVRGQGPRQPSPQQQGGQGGNRSVSPASTNQTLVQGASSQQWAGGPRQHGPMSQPRPQAVIQGEPHGMRYPGPSGQQFQPQRWQQQQNVKVLVDMAPQPIPTLGGGGNVIQPQQPIGVVGSAGRTSPGQVRGQRPQGPQGIVTRGRGRGRGQPGRAQFQQQRFQSPQQQQVQPQSTAPRPQGAGPRSGPRGRGRVGPQAMGPRMQMPGPRPQGVPPQGQGAPAVPLQGQVRPQKRSVKDRIGIPQQGNTQPQPVTPQGQRRVIQSQPQPQQTETNSQKKTLQTGTSQGGINQQPAVKNRTVLQHMTPQQRLLQQKQQRRAAQVAQAVQAQLGTTSQPARVLPPQPQRVVKQMSVEGAQVVQGPSGVLIDGLSASTNRSNLAKMLQTCGPIKNVEIIPNQRRAVAKFCRPEDAQTFKTKFHRHMIDLAHINVSLVPD